MTTTVQCPTCNTGVRWVTENTHRPFCSQRCQQIDFGDWATESFSIAGDSVMDSASLGTEDVDS
ncbi:MAG: DNA gyrase inhibitor YacG [Porticoccaceae bacterium]|nr:DNA gyrase inhibitor YacG [Porticoccaceae bacterium]MDG1474888.1 DNA gyrase inhibitor YacG [Porticoccaceae bacterium]